jgi:hypothetical protein
MRAIGLLKKNRRLNYFFILMVKVNTVSIFNDEHSLVGLTNRDR